MADFAPRSMKRKNVKGLALNAAPKPAPTPDSSRRDGAADAQQLEIGIEYNLDLRPEDLQIIKELGSGNGGTVSKVRHTTTGTVMARKMIHVEANKEMRKRIVRELQIMHGCRCEYIVTFYGAFLNPNNDVIMCMEYMDVGALDRVSRVFGPVRVDVLGKIAEATLGGLTYLYSKHHIMHRDIKPSNILVNSRGHIKLCDFGVSGELVNSIADTFVGTSTYMAPERIQGERYTVKSDVWSFGLTVMELAIGKFPFGSSEQQQNSDAADCEPAGILDLLQQIVHEPAPKLPKSDAFPAILEDMVQKCLSKKPEDRPTPQELYDREPFVQAAKRTPVDLREWAVGLLERDNRKSHLAPQPSPATQDLLRTNSSDSPSTYPSTASETPAIPTPTSGEIPIASGGVVSPFGGGSQQPQQHHQAPPPPPPQQPPPPPSQQPPPLPPPPSSSSQAPTHHHSQHQHTNRSPTRNGGVGVSGGARAPHPGLGLRANSMPRPGGGGNGNPNGESGSAAPASGMANSATFSLPVRPAPPVGGLPPLPRKDGLPDDTRRESRRQGTWGMPSGGGGGATNY